MSTNNSHIEPELAPVRYAREFYAILEADAVEEQTGDQFLTVWRGKLTDVFNKVGATNKYYSTIRSILLKSGSITIVEAGARNRDSTVVLNHAPPDGDEIAKLGLTGARPAGKMWEGMAQRLSALEGWRETTGGINIAEALRDMERRLTRLEGKPKTKTGGK